jgi:hypothetical protein
VGSLVAALFGTQYIDANASTGNINLMFSGLFVLLTLLGTSTVMQLARLRAAWYESALAMNQMKDYMVSENPGLIKAFRWRASTLPSKFKKDSISYYQSVEVALISGLMFAAAIFFFQRAYFPMGLLQWIISAVTGVVTIFVQLLVYERALK